MTKAILESQSLTFAFAHQDQDFLKNIDLEAYPGQCLFLIGRSGSGKTTLSRFFNGLSPEYFQGEMKGSARTGDLLAGQAPIENYVPVVGSVFQNPSAQHFNIDSTSELAFPCENMGWLPDKIEDRIFEVTQLLEIEHLLGRSLFELSGGEKQKIAIASALMLKPKVLVLDEITSNLDPESTDDMAVILKKIKSSGVTILATDHRLAWARDLADGYLYLEKGRVTQAWTREEFLSLTEKETHAYGLRHHDLSPSLEKLDHLKKLGPKRTKASLRLKNLQTGYGDKLVSSITSLDFHSSEIVGILGENGVGKTTLARTVCGLHPPLSGDILFKGQAASAKVLNRNLFLVMQNPDQQLFSDTVFNECLQTGASHSQIKELLEDLDLYDLREAHPKSMSGGEKQRLVIALALLSNREVIIFDEPSSGLDYLSMEKVSHLIKKLADLNKTVLIISHDLELLALTCDRLINMEAFHAEN